MAERDRRRIAAVLATDTDLEVRAGLAALLDGDAHHRADALAVEHLERVARDDLLLHVLREERLLRIVARYAEDGLREVVRPEREELGLRGDLVGDETCARDLDHRPELVRDALAPLLEYRFRYLDDLLLQPVELTHRADEGHHDLRFGADALPGHVDGRADDRADLHLEDLGEHEQESAPAQAEHGVVLLDLPEPFPDLLFLRELRAILAQRLVDGDLHVEVRVLAQELVQRRIDETDDDGEAVHRGEHLAEVALLEREELRERRGPARG